MKDKLIKLTQLTGEARDYRVPLTLDDVDGSPSKIRIEFRDGIYQYIPRPNTFNRDARFNYKELLLIVDKLKELNK